LLPTPYYHLFYLATRIKSADYSQPKSVVQTPLMPLPKPLSIMVSPLSVPIAELRWCYTPGDSNSIFIPMHCIVTGGGFDGKMGASQTRKRQLLVSRKDLSKMYKAIFLKNPKWS
jgi:hypothetical protein